MINHAMKKPLDKTKLNAMTNLFVEFFESQGVTFVDVTDDLKPVGTKSVTKSLKK